MPTDRAPERLRAGRDGRGLPWTCSSWARFPVSLDGPKGSPFGTRCLRATALYRCLVARRSTESVHGGAAFGRYVDGLDPQPAYLALPPTGWRRVGREVSLPAPHGSGRAEFPHPALRVTGSLLEAAMVARCVAAEARSAPAAETCVPTSGVRVASGGGATCATHGGPYSEST